MWTMMRETKGAFTGAQIAARTGDHIDTVMTFLKALVKGKYLRTMPSPDAPVTRHVSLCLVHDIGRIMPPIRSDGSIGVRGLKQANMWRTIKMLKGIFTARDLMMAAAQPTASVTLDEARDYLSNLSLAGYVHAIERGGPNRLTRYVFNSSRNTGPLAPMVQRCRSVFDQNECRVVWVDKSMEAAE
jgi:hypothetical protein